MQVNNIYADTRKRYYLSHRDEICKYYKERGEHAAQNKLYYCNCCDKSLKSSLSLTRHNVTKKHNNLASGIVITYNCLTCDKTFGTKGKYSRHCKGNRHIKKIG